MTLRKFISTSISRAAISLLLLLGCWTSADAQKLFKLEKAFMHSLDGTFHTLMDLSFVAIVFESTDIRGTGRAGILTRFYGFRTILYITLLLGFNNTAAEEQAQKQD